MSGLRTVFDDITNILKSIKNEYGERVFKTVEVNKGQMMRVKGFENTGENIMFPAVFYKPEEIKNLPRPNNVYVTEMRIRFYICTNELIRDDYLDIFDLPQILDNALLNSKWTDSNLVSIRGEFEMFPETWDNTQIYEKNYWVKYWNLNAYQYSDYVDANDVNINPEAPVELDLNGYIDDDEEYPQ